LASSAGLDFFRAAWAALLDHPFHHRLLHHLCDRRTDHDRVEGLAHLDGPGAHIHDPDPIPAPQHLLLVFPLAGLCQNVDPRVLFLCNHDWRSRNLLRTRALSCDALGIWSVCEGGLAHDLLRVRDLLHDLGLGGRPGRTGAGSEA